MKPVSFHMLVDQKVEASVAVDGWKHGPRHICAEMADETVDIPSWGRGLDQHPMTPTQFDRQRRIETGAHELWLLIEAQKASYG